MIDFMKMFYFVNGDVWIVGFGWVLIDDWFVDVEFLIVDFFLFDIVDGLMFVDIGILCC